jgi:hypothetical protein
VRPYETVQTGRFFLAFTQKRASFACPFLLIETGKK